ncbi:hypothetical protein CN918_25385 [Priestia megaterium]|nr:hypothetical protein CN918_25385 [Priestia megaterium]
MGDKKRERAQRWAIIAIIGTLNYMMKVPVNDFGMEVIIRLLVTGIAFAAIQLTLLSHKKKQKSK